MKRGFSIIICCYNSASRLPETLRHIALQKVAEEISWEVIVINNASQDDTKEVAGSIWQQLGCLVKFSIVDESKAGLSAARDRGLQVSEYDYLLFCDDDNWLEENYVQQSFNIMQSDELIGALGGQFEAVCEIDPPGWFNYFASNYTVGKQASVSGEITFSKSYVSGAGAVYRKSVLLYLKENGFKSLLTDRKGNTLSTGGDVEIGYAIRMAGYKIWYDERLKLKHFIPKERLTRNYIERLYNGYLESLPVHLAYEQNFLPRKAYKKTVGWLLLMRFILFIKKKLLLPSSYNEPWIAKMESRLELNYMKSIIKNRKEYVENLNRVKNSNWHITQTI